MTAQAVVHEDGLQTPPGYAQPTENSAMSRRRLSFFAQLQRPKQVYKKLMGTVSFTLFDVLQELPIKSAHWHRVNNTVSAASAHLILSINS